MMAYINKKYNREVYDLMNVLTKKKKITLIIIGTILSIIIGCDGSEELKNVDVYVGGHYILGNTYTSCYWENGKRVDLNKQFSLVDVFGDGTDMFAASSLKEGNSDISRAAYWKNGVSTELLSTRSATRQVIVKDGETTILGYSMTDSSDDHWVSHWIWRDGEFSQLDGFVMSMEISDGDLYLAGSYSDIDRRPCYWKNGIRHDLEADDLDLDGLIIRDIAVSNGDVYVVGRYRNTELKENRAALWKNGVRQDLESISSDAYSITIDGSDVYVAGQVNCTACYWKNGKRISLGGSACSYAKAITTCNGNVYIAGHDAGTDKGVLVWKNNKNLKVELSYPWAVSRSAYAHSIFVKAK